MKLNPTQTIVAIKAALEADVNIMQWGDSGIGKSAMTRQAVKALYQETLDGESYIYAMNEDVRESVANGTFDYRIEDLRMAQMDIADWGLPLRRVELADGRLMPIELAQPDTEYKDVVDTFTRPEWWPAEDYNGLYVLFMDELNRGEKYSQNGAMQITAERQLRQRLAPKHMRLVSACNPATGGFVTDELDTAMKARWCHVAVSTANKSFLKNRADYLDDISTNIIFDEGYNALVKPMDGVKWSVQEEVEWRPRTWEMHAKYAKYLMWLSETKGMDYIRENAKPLKAIVTGLIGMVNGGKWWQAFTTGQFINLEGIANGKLTYDKIKELGSDKPTLAAMLIKNNLCNSTFIDPATGKGSNQRAENISEFIKALIAERRELAAVLSQHFANLMGSKEHSVVLNVIASIDEYADFIKSVNAIGDEDNEL